MASTRARSLRPALTALVLAACGNGPGLPFIADAGPGGGDGGDPDGGNVCTTLLCGDPSVCCDAGDECIEDVCVAPCATGVRCGAALDTCCAAGDVCLAAACVTPGAACADSYDCPPGEFCEPTLGQCLPQPDPLTCELQPTFADLTVAVEWSFEGRDIITIPVVANLDDDATPEVVVNAATYNVPAGSDFNTGNIVVLDGATGAVQFEIPEDLANGRYGSAGRFTAALGDVDGDVDLRPDIVYAARPVSSKHLIVAVDHTGAPLWTSHAPGGAAYGIRGANAAITLANFDADAGAEVVIGATLLDNDGTVLWDQGGDGAGGNVGTNNGYQGGISAVADLDGDGVPEIITGRNAWKVAWTAGPPATAAVTPYWTYGGNDGYPAIADLDQDGTPEVVLVASRQVIVLDGQSGLLWCGVDPDDSDCAATPALRTQPIDIPGAATNNRGGPPTIADFDVDGRPEIGVAGGTSYSLYDLARVGEDLTGVAPTPSAGALFVRWSQTTQDASSNATGSSVFDFQGDGEAEVVYADECKVRVYAGTDGRTQVELDNTTATIHEYPLVVDADGDGNSEILVVANTAGAVPSCPGVVARHGLFVYGDANDEWVPTRKVWTQHAYHVTNATSAGNCPLIEDDNWTQPGLNNYRQNVQGDGIFNAPDLAVELSVGLEACDEQQLVLRARVSNLGALGVPPGAVVEFYRGPDATGTPLGSAATTVPLLPGSSTTVTLTVPAAGGEEFAVEVDGATDVVAECLEDNNADNTTAASCGVVID